MSKGDPFSIQSLLENTTQPKDAFVLEDELMKFSVAQLRKRLQAIGIDDTHAASKRDVVDLLTRAMVEGRHVHSDDCDHDDHSGHGHSHGGGQSHGHSHSHSDGGCDHGPGEHGHSHSHGQSSHSGSHGDSAPVWQPQSLPACAVCNQGIHFLTAVGQVSFCSRCKKVAYCGVEHQRQDWPKHKALCH